MIYFRQGDHMKRFKSKKTRRRGKVLCILFLVVLSFSITVSFLSAFLQKDEVLDFLLETTLRSNRSWKENTSIIDFLTQYTFGKQELEEEVYDGSTSKQEYTPDPNPSENEENPKIYLYNTHQGEEYAFMENATYNVVPTVMLASYKLREELNKRGIPTMVETNPLSEILRTNGWNYNSSYQASRLLLESAREKNPSLEYFFDLHRDSISYESSMIEVSGQKYAKVLFVIGTDYEGYEENLLLANKISDLLNQKVPNISRGILKKGGKGVNGIYNEDFSSKTLLFEIGGPYNSMSEVSNTLLVLADVIKELG